MNEASGGSGPMPVAASGTRGPPATPLLPNEPRILDAARAQALTARHLSPDVPAVQALFLTLRGAVDAELGARQPVKQGKPYPLGQCLEVSRGLLQRLSRLDPTTLPRPAAMGYRRLAAFTQAGGQIRQVWGGLRGEYFQNALLVGTLYVDVANDTVDAAKPPVEIAPFAESGLHPIADFLHFARVARRYWQAEVFPNHVLPALAPYFPWITVSGSGLVRLQSASDYMIALSEAGAFHPAEAVLTAPPMPTSLFDALRTALVADFRPLPETPTLGRDGALHHCRRAREQRAQHDHAARDRAVRQVLAVNAHLASFNALSLR